MNPREARVGLRGKDRKETARSSCAARLASRTVEARAVEARAVAGIEDDEWGGAEKAEGAGTVQLPERDGTMQTRTRPPA